ncbi:lysophospholipid acyltransferase family protein [Pseudoruegeria sp. SK021]|uniref:lysophospholipid acyltransferase family protein n=1 Tax=Pseudoruegeria sp. SK021 TaxID=1933035 RepID=UPI000A259D86|nr:lysophospholipid acyltransferase family protein [Pseudoruegeria sp. SK021]OSP55531.1 acyltransferase [Pseudoruegeria sp. SK021]
MKHRHEVAREISYAHGAQTRSGRVMIRALENATGRLKLIRQARGYEDEVACGRDFWEVMAERYGLSINVIGGSLDSIPREGPLVLVANHPFGICDGLIMGLILSKLRGDFRILAHKVFRKAADLDRVILPISFDETREAMQQNLDTRKAALGFLAQGGAIGIFPGGTVSTSAKPFSEPLDPGWRGFTARMIARSPAHVVPIYFSGHNSRMFQVASHLHNTLRLGLLIKEFNARVNKPVDVVIGQPIDRTALDRHARDTRAMMDFLRSETYKLSSVPGREFGYGFEFEDRYKQ